jgi:hypothetical protein
VSEPERPEERRAGLTMWEIVYVAAIAGLNANPHSIDWTGAQIASFAVTQANAAVKRLGDGAQ